MVNDHEEMESVLEAILFVTADPVPPARLLEVFDEAEREDAAAALERVLARYRGGPDQPRRGVMVDEVAGGVRLVTRPELHGYLRRFFEVTGANRLSMPAIETLAIIAYRQPITGPEIQELRGKNSSGVLKTLLERRMVRISGRKEVVGRPFLYATTRDFLLHFGLRGLDDLPPLEELEETLRGEGDFAFAGVETGALAGEDVEVDREEQIQRQLALVEESEDADGPAGEDAGGPAGEDAGGPAGEDAGGPAGEDEPAKTAATTDGGGDIGS